MSTPTAERANIEEVMAQRIAKALSHIGPECFWVFIGRTFNTNAWRVYLGNQGEEDGFLTVVIDRRNRPQPLEWRYALHDGLHPNESFSSRHLSEAEVDRAIRRMVDYLYAKLS